MCQHLNFDVQAKVAFLADINHHVLELRVTCVECGTPFQFLGLEAGLDLHGARCDLDALEARIGIVPKGTSPNPFQRLQFGIKRFDS